MASETSNSERWRQDGNRHFKAAKNLSPILKIEKYKKAQAAYQKAFNTASEHSKTGQIEKCSAVKNLFVVTSKIAGILAEKRDQGAWYWFKECVRFGDTAVRLGKEATMSCDWIDGITGTIEDVIGSYFVFVDHFNSKNKITLLNSLAEVPDNAGQKTQIFLKLTKTLFHQAVVQLSHDNDHKACIQTLSEAYTPITKCEEHWETITDDVLNVCLGEDLDELKADILKTRSIAESMRCIALGDQLQEKNIRDNEEINIDMMWEVIDFYHQAIIQSKEADVEQEAIALSRLGCVYHEVFLLKDKAKANFMRSMALATSLQPRNFGTEVWFQKASSILSEYQRFDRLQEEKKHQEKRQMYLDQQKEVLDKLREMSDKSAQKLMCFVYKEHPPKHREVVVDLARIEQCPYEQCKKYLTKCILHYHPDRVDKEKHGMKWFVLCEEITKYLTAKHNGFKGC